MKNILLLVHNDSGQEARLQVALDVTRAVSGHLTCVDVVDLSAMAGDDVGYSGADMLLDVERSKEASNRNRLKARLAQEDVAWNWVDVTDFLEPAIRNASDLADLIVVNSMVSQLELPDVRRVAGSLAVKSGKPILAVPDTARGLDTFGDVIIAWDGSKAASAATAAAVPLLQMARLVTLFEVRDGSNDTPVEDAARYLSRHTIRCEIVSEIGTPDHVADLIHERTDSGRFAYLVMGAYSRPRIVEALFGGVTQRMLKDCLIPLLLAH
jgi:nucleotide-binding universal stress UspA family protein